LNLDLTLLNVFEGKGRVRPGRGSLPLPSQL